MAPHMHLPLNIRPPLVNSSNPWATTAADLRALYECPATGAVTVRTSLLDGFAHDDATHRFAFFASQSHAVAADAAADSSLNTLGYSPIALGEYLEIVEGVVRGGAPAALATANGNGETAHAYKKPFIISVTGTPAEIVKCRQLIQAKALALQHPLYMEINLSCPNIKDHPPPAYDGAALLEYLTALQDADRGQASEAASVPVGIKLPPYTYMDQFHTVVSALLVTATSSSPCPVTFITSTNTLGSSLVLSPSASPGEQSQTQVPTLSSPSDPSSTGIGGLAGAALHPLSLGNVATLRRLLDASGNEAVRAIEIIGIGGVSDKGGFDRMRSVGASIVGVGTALGISGVGVFAKILGTAGL